MRSTRLRASTGAAALALLVLLLLVPSAQATTASVVPGPVAAAPAPESAPANPAFVLWQAMNGLEPVLRAASPHGLGLTPSPASGYVVPSGASPASSDVARAFPSSYDLRTLAKLTPVRNQGAYGTCWTFAALGSLESSSLPGESLDLSEDNLALTSGFDIDGAATPADKYDAGGNLDMATAYLARWGGPVWETDDAYGDGVTPGGLTARRHVQNVDVYAGRTSPTDNDRIKTAVSNYGATYVSMYWTDAAYTSTTKAYYYDGTTSGTNHAVLVVGWDDNYAAGNFSPAAPGNGAFIVRNSWGGSWGASGYFHVSYYDTRFACQYTSGGYTYSSDAATFEAAQPSANYGKVYQYDPLGKVSSLGLGTGTPIWGANVYTATSASVLNAVGFYANAPNTAYEIWEGPSTSSLTRLAAGTLAQMGYHTVAVPEGTLLANGATFVVAVKLTTPGYRYALAYEYPETYYSDGATAAPGQSYYSSNGTSWTDLTSYEANANACIKAFASAVSSAPTSTSSYGFAADASSGWKTSSQSVTVTASGGDGTGRTICFSQDNGSTWNSTVGDTATFTVSTQGSHHIRYYAKTASATEPVHDAGYVNIDTVAPATSDDHLTASLVAPATITLTPADATSGMNGGAARTEYKVDGAATYSTGTSVVLSTAGAHTVVYRSTDKAGNVETPDKTFTVTVNGPGWPTSTSSYAFAADATSGWKTDAMQVVTVNATGGAGTDLTIHFSQDGGASWSLIKAGTHTAPLTGEGAHHIEYYASDSLATERTHDAGWVNIDSVAPVTTDDHPASGTAPLTVTLTPSDATSGLSGGSAKTEYKVDGAGPYAIGTSIVLGAGEHTVAYRSTDKAGNVESPDKTFTVTVTEPTTPATACGFAFSPDAVSGWTNSPQLFTITAAGGIGTGRTIHYSLDGGATWSTSGLASVDVPVTTNGAHRVQYYADDSLGRESTHDAGWINIDTGMPSTRAGKAGVRRGAKVTLRYRVTDPPQGCGKAVLKLQIRKRSKVVKTIALGTKATNAALGYRYRARLKPGTYSWRVLATDLAGNVAVKVTSARLVIR